MLLPISLTLAAACALVNLWLAVRCVRIRFKERALHGDAGHPLLAQRMRAQANFTEYTPILLILTALVELAIGSPLWLWIVAAAYAAARVAHGFGMDRANPNLLRAGGALITWAATAGLAAAALYAAYHATRETPAPPALAARV